MRIPPLPALALALALIAAPACAAESHPAAAAGSVLQVLLGLVAVLALMAGTAWLLKRFGVSGAAGSNVARVIGGVSVGNRERVVVVEVADQWIVVGVAQGRVSALSTMPRQERPASAQQPTPNNFAGWLKQTIDKRNGNQ
jgi:flagellar protein FliO/FliZ